MMAEFVNFVIGQDMLKKIASRKRIKTNIVHSVTSKEIPYMSVERNRLDKTSMLRKFRLRGVILLT